MDVNDEIVRRLAAPNEDLGTVRSRLEERYRAASLAFPGVALELSQFSRWVATRMSPDGPRLEQLHTDGLYLAAACALGDRSALAHFETHCLADAAHVVRRVSRSIDVDEMLQMLRERLFVRSGAAREEKILQYSGRGTLHAWVRVVLTRLTLDCVGRAPPEHALDDSDLPELTLNAPSAELAYFRAHYEPSVKALLPVALGALSPRERLYLRQHYLDQLSLAELSRLHSVHVATIKRHLANARETLTERLEALMRERLGLTASEFTSVMRLIRSQLHVSMHKLLPRTADEA